MSKIYKRRILPNNWNWRKISDFAKTASGGTPKSTNKAYYEDGTIPWINSGELNSPYISTTTNFITIEGLKNSSAKLFPVNSVLVALYGATAGKASLLKIEATTNQAVCAILPNENYDPLFLKFSIDSLYSYLIKISTGSARDNLSQDIIKELQIGLPVLKQQQRIASVLSSLDDKIELNNRINAELEAMAKTLYDYWFVQFDFPNEEGKPYKSSGGKIVYNEKLKREIPEGWKVKLLGDEFETLLGGTPSTANKSFWENGTINWLNSGEIANFPILTSELSITQDAINKSSTNLLPKGSVLLSITRHLRTSILAIDACINQSVIGIQPNFNIKSNYLYPYVKNEIPRLMGLRTGAQQPHINKDIVDNSYIMLPESSIIKQYNERTDKIYDLIIDKAKENQQLVSLRDWLLPMLMNGQVGFKEEKQEQSQVVNMAAELESQYRGPAQQDQRFELWLSNQGLAARGKMDKSTLREIFNIMDKEEYGK